MVELDGWGNRQSVQLAQGTISYRDLGAGSTLLFVHGLLANGTLWRDVVPLLAGNFRCIVPDLPLGGHSVAMNPGADLTPPGMAQIVADIMDVLDLHDVILVGNDTGGAICQIVVATHPQRLAGLVLTNCDAYEAFFPLLISPFHYGARFLGERFTDGLGRILRYRPAQRLLLWTVARRRMDEPTLDAYFASFVGIAGVRRDTARFLAAVSNRFTLDAARSFSSFRRPVLIVWGTNDVFFPSRLAHRLQRDFADARLTFVSGSRAFVPEDQPEVLASQIAGFVGGGNR